MLTDAFVSAVRRQGVIPSTYSDADVLGVGDGEVLGTFVPLLEFIRQDHLVRTVTINADALGRYPLPKRAVAGGLRSVQLQVSNSWVSLPQRQMEEADFRTTGLPSAYFLDAGSIVLLPTGTAGPQRVRYSARPSSMVALPGGGTASAAAISTVTAGATTTSISCATNAIVGTVVDIVGNGPTHPLKAIEATIQSGTITTGGPVTLLNAELAEAPVTSPVTYVQGNPPDFICQAGVTPFVPIPEELSAALVHRTAGVILRSLGYQEEAAQQLTLAGEVIASATPMLSPRNEGNPQVVRGGVRRALNQWRQGWRY